MESQPIELITTAEDHRIARLTAAAIGLSLIDAAIPLPLPGIKPGLANIVDAHRSGTLRLAFGAVGQRFARACWRARTGAISLSPGFFMSLSGAIASLAVLGLAERLPRRWFGPVSWSSPGCVRAHWRTDRARPAVADSA